ncbi:zinc knuckle CX2CX4HX4C containing protein [Tanacetum coccineum]
MDHQTVHNEGEELLQSVALRMNKMTGKGDVSASLPRMPVRGSQNPNLELDYTRVSEVPIINHMDSLHLEGTNKSNVNVGAAPLGVSSTIKLSFMQDPSQSGGDQSGVSTYGQNDGVSSWLINETNVETLFGVKFTSQSDIEVFSMSIREGKYADILSTMSSANIDAAVNAIETFGKKFHDDVSNSSPLVSPSTTINMPRELNSIDVAATFRVPLSTVGDLHKLINDIEAGKHDELLSGITNDDHMETLDALGSICNSIQANHDNAYVIPCKVSYAYDSINLNVDESTIPSDPIIQSVDINTKSTSYAGVAGASAKDQLKVNSNFRTLVANPVFDGVNISIPFKVVEKAKHGLKRIMMNSKGLFFFKFDSRAGLEAVLEGGPWLIRKSLIILKKWSMDTRLLKEELTRILIWVKLHDVPIQVFKEDGISLIAKFIEADLVDVVTIGILSLSGDGFTNETIRVDYEWRPPRCDICKIFGHVPDYCPKKMMTPPIVTTYNIVTPTFTGPSVKQNVRYEPNTTTTAPRKGATYVGNTPQSPSMLKTTEDDDEKDVENVHDESANLIQNIKAGGSSSFTAADGLVKDQTSTARRKHYSLLSKRSFKGLWGVGNEQALKNVLDKMMDQEKEASEQSDAKVKILGIFCQCLFDDEDLDTYNSPFADQVMELTKIAQALDDESGVEAMQEELLYSENQKVWKLVNLPMARKPIYKVGSNEFNGRAHFLLAVYSQAERAGSALVRIKSCLPFIKQRYRDADIISLETQGEEIDRNGQDTPRDNNVADLLTKAFDMDSGILWKLILLFPDLRVMVPLSNLITALAILRNGVPKMKVLFSSSFMSKITKSTRFFKFIAGCYVSIFTPFFLPSGERNGIYVLGNGEFSLSPYQYFFRSSAGREFFKKPEHFSHSNVDLLVLLENALMVVESEVLNDFPRFVGILITDFSTGGAVNLPLNMKGDMIVKNLDLKPTIDAMMRDFLHQPTGLALLAIRGILGYVYIIGGDGTQKEAYAIYEEVRRQGLKVAVVRNPNPIDNDKNVIINKEMLEGPLILQKCEGSVGCTWS